MSAATIAPETAGRSLELMARLIRAEIDAAELAWNRALRHAIRAGELLIEAKAQVKHGQWLPWLHDHGIAVRTAQRYMQLARKAPDVAHLPTLTDAISALQVPKPTVRVPVCVTPSGPLLWRHLFIGANGERVELWREEPDRPHPSAASTYWTVPWVTDCPRCGHDLYAAAPTSGPAVGVGSPGQQEGPAPWQTRPATPKE